MCLYRVRQLTPCSVTSCLLLGSVAVKFLHPFQQIFLVNFKGMSNLLAYYINKRFWSTRSVNITNHSQLWKKVCHNFLCPPLWWKHLVKWFYYSKIYLMSERESFTTPCHSTATKKKFTVLYFYILAWPSLWVDLFEVLAC